MAVAETPLPKGSEHLMMRIPRLMGSQKLNGGMTFSFGGGQLPGGGTHLFTHLVSIVMAI